MDSKQLDTEKRRRSHFFRPNGFIDLKMSIFVLQNSKSFPMFLTSLTVLKTSQKMITQKSNKKYRKVVGIRKWSTTHKERIYNKFFFNVVIGDGSYRILHVTPCVWTAGLFDSSCTCVQSRVLLYKDIGTVFQELKGST